MNGCISIKTDYSILSSMIKIPDLISYALKNNINVLGIIDNNLCASAEFKDACFKNNIKPIIGLDITLNDEHIYLYAKNNKGYQALLKINTYILDNEVTFEYLKQYGTDLIIILPYEHVNLLNNLKEIGADIFIGYQNESEKKEISNKYSNIIFFKIAKALSKEDTFYLNYLNMIKDNLTYDNYNDLDYSNTLITINEVGNFASLINLTKEKHPNLIPIFDHSIDSYKYLETLAITGLKKRLNGKVSSEYKDRLLFELKTIKDMNFTDYFLIVYDYVKYAKNNNIYVGPGRGSAVGSLVTYSLGITSADPIKYNLLFERFLNKERITMPDIDIDFDAEKRHLVINYVKEKYGRSKAMPIMTYGTLTTKQVLLSTSKILKQDITHLLSLIDHKKTLKENLTKDVINYINHNKDVKKVYYDAMHLEGIKKHISTNAAGVVIASVDLDEVIPIVKSGNDYLAGYSKDYLEAMGLLKMDFLSIKNLTSIARILENIPTLNINNIDLNDPEVLNSFAKGDTTGIFQFESIGMRNFLKKLKPSNFNEVAVALALYRPGPSDNIDAFIRRKEGKEKVDYIIPELEKTLKETYGIIVYQEQIMQIIKDLASYSYSEADIIRRAIAKKNESVINEQRAEFTKRALNNGYQLKDINKIYDLIMKFAEYGFNKSHSIGYATTSYQMMYLKIKYPIYFYSSMLNLNLDAKLKTKEYINEAKMHGIKVIKPDINLSEKSYQIINNEIIMPLSSIKDIGIIVSENIISERSNGKFIDYFDFIKRTFAKGVNQKVITNLILAGALDSFKENRNTLINNLKAAMIYAELASGLDSSLVNKPELEKVSEYDEGTLMNYEYDLYGFYVSNHPASKYNFPKHNLIKNYFDKDVITVGLIEKITIIDTKNKDKMAFITLNDETGSLEYTIFPNKMNSLTDLKKNDLIKVWGRVAKRYDKYQIIVNKIEKLKI